MKYAAEICQFRSAAGAGVRDRYTNRLTFACVHFIETEQEKTFGDLMFPDARTFEIDAALLEEDWQLTAKVWKVLRCADYFGYSPEPGERVNWDALLDGLRSVDEDTTRAKDYLLIIRNAAVLWQRLPRIAGTFTEVWLSAADFWAEQLETGFDLVYVW